MSTYDIELPPFPEGFRNCPASTIFHASSIVPILKDYARSAVEAHCKRHDLMLAHEWIRPALGLPEDAPYRFDFYAQKIEELISDRRLRGEPVACETCGTSDVSLELTCHNSSCANYAEEVTVYEGWEDISTVARQARLVALEEAAELADKYDEFIAYDAITALIKMEYTP